MELNAWIDSLSPVSPSKVAAELLGEKRRTVDSWRRFECPPSFAADLDLPPYLRNDPDTRRLFRHWCASNVTVDEVEQAAVRAVAEGRAPSPAILHEHLKALRLEKIRAAS